MTAIVFLDNEKLYLKPDERIEVWEKVIYIKDIYTNEVYYLIPYSSIRYIDYRAQEQQV